MRHGLPFFPRFVCLVLLASVIGCGGGGDGDSQPTRRGTSSSRASASPPDEPNAAVEVVINRAPRITSMVSSAGRVDSDVPVTLTTAASDADGDALAFLWKSTCPGTFDRTNAARVTFTTQVLPAETTACAFDVVVSDGHGADARGTLTLSAVEPRIDVGPILGPVAQSTDLAAVDEGVVLHATGSGRGLTWTWQASVGTLSGQNDTAETSDVHWQVPATPGADCTITVTATDVDGASTTHTFTVRVSS